jgi:hypothetical protein
MKFNKQVVAIGTILFMLSGAAAFANDHGHGHGNGHGKSEAEYWYSDHNREALRGWYDGRRGNLPPGLAKKDELPPGLEKQLVRNGTLPPGLRKKMYSCPTDVVRLLPPPPPDCGHFLIGGHVVLVNRRTYMILDMFRF